MKRKLTYFFIIFCLTLCCTGCIGDITRGIRHAGFSLSPSEFKCDAFVSKKLEEASNNEKIWYFDSGRAITSAGQIYELSLGQIFSNEQNCMLADFSGKAVAVMDNKIFKSSDNKLRYLYSDGNTLAYSEVTANNNLFGVYKLLFNLDGVKKITTYDENSGIYYVLKDDGNIYKVVINKGDNKSAVSLVSQEVAYSSSTYGKIIDFSYTASIATNYIRSEEKIYRMKITNYENCSQYANVECTYEMYEDTPLMEYKDYILAFNGSMLVTNYGKEFTATYN